MYDFTQFFGQSHYSVKCKVNTDIYQFCGMKKVICVSEFDKNLIHHLPDRYINHHLSIEADDKMNIQLEILLNNNNGLTTLKRI